MRLIEKVDPSSSSGFLWALDKVEMNPVLFERLKWWGWIKVKKDAYTHETPEVVLVTIHMLGLVCTSDGSHQEKNVSGQLCKTTSLAA